MSKIKASTRFAQQTLCKSLTNKGNPCKSKARPSGYCDAHEEKNIKRINKIEIRKSRAYLNRYVLDAPNKTVKELSNLIRIPYKQYLKTAHWERTRRTMLKLNAYRCSKCGTENRKLHVHHKTYENLFMEKIKDLWVVCDKCHGELHK